MITICLCKPRESCGRVPHFDQFPGLVKPSLISVAQRFPRSHVAGIVLLTIGLAWTFWLPATIQMGRILCLPAAAAHCAADRLRARLRFVEEFLAVARLEFFACWPPNRCSMRPFYATKRAAPRYGIRLSADRCRTVLGCDSVRALSD